VLQACVRSGKTMAQLLDGVTLFPQTLINVRLQPGQDWKKQLGEASAGRETEKRRSRARRQRPRADPRQRHRAAAARDGRRRAMLKRGACKLTLEVLSGNAPALRAYEREGFEGYQLDPAFGHAVFLQKKL
jgi:hypothetical protein